MNTVKMNREKLWREARKNTVKNKEGQTVLTKSSPYREEAYACECGGTMTPMAGTVRNELKGMNGREIFMEHVEHYRCTDCSETEFDLSENMSSRFSEAYHNED